ncbi:MAG: ABC transporter ATP-binding protein [Clostridia bacterium]|nr:ABC transporter ATP-binding protein [Clostridia bacterium]
MEAIRATGLCKTYRDVTAVKGLDLTVAQGELFALLGVNGAGKTTAIRMLTCLTQPTAGEAWILGKSILKDTAEVKETIAISPQETAVAPGLTVRENLALICGVHGYSREKTRTSVDDMERLMGLAPVMNRRAGKLSGGWQRRLSIAMALISQPQVLFLDEPTLGLDVIARSELWRLIRGLKGRVTIILTTHYLEEAEALSDRIGVMKDGRLVACGTAAELMQIAEASDFQTAFIRLAGRDAE